MKRGFKIELHGIYARLKTGAFRAYLKPKDSQALSVKELQLDKNLVTFLSLQKRDEILSCTKRRTDSTKINRPGHNIRMY